jgi:myosin V
LQTDLEEAKAQEIAKLQETLHDMQLQVEEAKAMVVKEREAARKAIEEAPPVIKETPVLVEDTEKINSLTAEVEQLKVWWQLIFHWDIFIGSYSNIYIPLDLTCCLSYE